MATDPTAVARRIRTQRRILTRILRVSIPIMLLGVAAAFALGERVAETRMNVVIIPTLLAFFVSWLSILALWVLGVRDMRNKFRPGSAGAYEDDH